MATGNAPNGFTDAALAAALAAGAEAALRVINSGRPENPHTPGALHGEDKR